MREVYGVEVAPTASPGSSPFGEVAQEGGEELYTQVHLNVLTLHLNSPPNFISSPTLPKPQVLQCLLHPLGCDFQHDKRFHYSPLTCPPPLPHLPRFGLMEHLRKAFQVLPARHLELYSALAAEAPPPRRLALGVLAGRRLASRDLGGGASPYASVTLSAGDTKPRATACVPATLNPTWGETFTLAVAGSGEGEVQVQVWDAGGGREGRVDRLRRAGEVRDGRGLRTLITDTVIGTLSQHYHNL